MINDAVIISLLVLYVSAVLGMCVVAIKKQKKSKKKPHLRIVKRSK